MTTLRSHSQGLPIAKMLLLYWRNVYFELRSLTKSEQECVFPELNEETRAAAFEDIVIDAWDTAMAGDTRWVLENFNDVHNKRVMKFKESKKARTYVLVHTEGGECHGKPIVKGICAGCGKDPDMRSTSLWFESQVKS